MVDVVGLLRDETIHHNHSTTSPMNSSEFWTTGVLNTSLLYQPSEPGPGPLPVYLGILFSILCGVTVFGNALIMVSVYREPTLRTICNYFICSLAFSDLMVGLVVGPFAIIHDLNPDVWYFGNWWCHGWHATDILMSTASILNLCAISLDRYWAVTDPIDYPIKVSPKRAAIMIAIVWILSSSISFPAIIWWEICQNRQDEYDPDLVCNFPSDPVYIIVSSMVSFYIPLILMFFTYCHIYRTAYTQLRSLKSGSKPTDCADGHEMNLRIHRGGGGLRNNPPNKPSDGKPTAGSNGAAKGAPSLGRGPTAGAGQGNTKHSMAAFIPISKRLAKLAQEQRAARTLSIVMGLFVGCWLPFFIVNILAATCQDCVSGATFGTVTWLGYGNSAVNPVIYSFTNRKFRRAFFKTLCPRTYFRDRKKRLIKLGYLHTFVSTTHDHAMAINFSDTQLNSNSNTTCDNAAHEQKSGSCATVYDLVAEYVSVV